MMSRLNFNVKSVEVSGRPRPYNPRKKVALVNPWSIWMMLSVGAVMIGTFTVVWMMV
jgi:hypothetical protein